MSRSLKGILLGAALGAALYVLRLAVMPIPGEPGPLPDSAFQMVSDALLAVAPGYVAGWYAGQRGLLIGAAVGVLLTLIQLAIVWSWWGPMLLVPFAASLVFGATANVITQSPAGAGGELMRSRTPPAPNDSFKPKPLRGSA